VGAVVESKLTLDNINPAVLVTQYAVRGELVQRASAIQESNFAEKPYRKLLECNIGNPQAVGQSPLTFNRQVLSLLCYPELARNPAAAALFEPDAILRAKEYLQAIPNGLGAYSESQGFAIVRQDDATVLACGQFAREGELVGLYDVFTHEQARGQGLAGVLCERMLSISGRQGAKVAYLQVESANHPALAVYRRLGFAAGYGYHYRERQDG
jgi:GNAT superfamily N-acetyltransferase